MRNICTGQAGLGESDLGGGDGLAVGRVDDGALMAGERANAVAGTEKGEVGLDDAVEQTGELGLNPLLGV